MDEFAHIKDFKKKVVLGTGILFFVKIILFPIGLIVSVILARLLEPVHFGIYGILNFFVYTGYSISELGLIGFLVQQKQNPSLEECRAVFTLRLMLSAIIFTIIWIFFPFIRGFFNLPAQACSMIRIFSLLLLSEPFAAVSRAVLQRNLSYKIIGTLDVINTITYQVVVVIMAFYSFGTWSFIAASVVSATVTNLLYFVTSPWRLGFRLNKDIAKKVFRFGFFFQLTAMTAMLRDNIIAIFGGIAFGPRAVGYLSWGYGIANKLAAMFQYEVGRIMFPAIARIQNNSEAISIFFSKAIRYLMLFTAPIMCILIALSYEVIVLIFNPKWIPALPALVIFGILNLICHFVTVGDNLLKGLGKVKKDFIIIGIWTIATWLISVIIAKWLAYNAIAIGWALSSLIPTIWITNIVNRRFPIDLRGILNPLLAASLSAYLISLVKHIFTMNIYSLISLCVIGLFLYILFLYAIERRRAWHEILDLLRLVR